MARALRRRARLGPKLSVEQRGRGVSMRTATLGCLLLMLSVVVAAQSVEQQISDAVLPLPEGLRAGARVIALGADTKQSVLREGTNDWVCEADEPTEGFEVSCYYKNFSRSIHFRQLMPLTVGSRLGHYDVTALIGRGGMG